MFLYDGSILVLYIGGYKEMSKHNSYVASIFGSLSVVLPLVIPFNVHAQAVLEEVIVTAQRREQSLQEVPISIETFSGVEISRQGYRDMQELSIYSPTVTVEPDILRNSITIRGLGAASADALTIEQSSPTFVDGIHYGRTSQIKLAFLDVQSVEVLKGPQPVYFGQNAIAGAFNLTTRKPTAEWEANLNAEASNFNSQKVEFGAGGPINDTWGIRVAGTFERSDGYLQDVVTDEKFPSFKNYGGRVILQWAPTENFKATWKLESSDQKKGAEGKHVCVVDNPPVLSNALTALHEPQYVLLDRPYGVGWDVKHKALGACYESNDGILVSGALPVPRNAFPNQIAEAGNTILLNINSLEGLIPRISSADGFRQDNPQYSFVPHEDISPWNTYLNLAYTLDGGMFDGVELTSLTGYDYYLREYMRDNRGTPFYANFQNRQEDQWSFSQEFRATSPTGGTIEWMVGAYYQDVDYDFFSDSIRPNNRTGRRYNEGYEDARWKSVFGNITYNFMDNNASVDVGARYSNSSKSTFVEGWGAQWMMFDGFVFTWNQRSGPDSTPGPGTRFALYNGTSPIGMTKLTKFVCTNPAQGNTTTCPIPGPYIGEADQTELNPQIVLRYRPSDTMSMYAKYAESFKAAGFNTGQATLPNTIDEYSFGPEYGTNYEVGIKGELFDSRARYTISLFSNKIKDLQLAAATPSTDNNLLDFQNAGAQRVRGTEISFDWIPTDRLTLNLSAAIMDGVMLDYQGATCTEAEFANPAASGCDTSITNGSIDRSGTQAPNTPDWKIVMNADYVWPLSNGYEVDLNAKGFVSDGYITDTNGFSQVTKYNKHGDVGFSAGFGPQEGAWKLTAFARNVLEASPSYNAEFDLTPEAIQSPVVYRSSYMSYGLSFRYNYN